MQTDKLVSIDYFTGDMLGVGRQWYYKHKNDPGMPQRVFVGGKKPKLVLAECQAYVEQLKSVRPPQKRKRGRPRKTAAQVAALVRGEAA